MLSIIIGAILGLLVSFFIFRKPDLIEKFAFFTIGAILGASAALFIADNLECREVELLRTPLAAMRNGSGLSGQFVLGSGSIETSSVYRYLQKESDGGVTPAEVKADGRVRIYEDGSLQETGYLSEIYSLPSSNSAWKWFALGARRFVRYEFHVPEGTVVHQFKID